MANTKAANIESTIKEIATYLVENVFDILETHSFNKLRAVSECPEGTFYLNVAFHAFEDASCNLYVSTDTSRVRNDEEGNTWIDHDLEVSVNWPSHGNSAVHLVNQRVELLKRVAAIASHLHDTYSGTYSSIISTKEENERKAAEKEALREAEEQERQLQVIVMENSKRMRVNGSKLTDAPSSLKLQHGVRVVVEQDKKRFEVVRDGDTIVITRVS